MMSKNKYTYSFDIMDYPYDINVNFKLTLKRLGLL